MSMDQLLSYSSSEGELDDDECSPPPRKKKRTLPPLSGSLLPKVPVDDPALHQGRIRTTPHVEGQWAAYVYVPVFIEKREKLGSVLKDSLETARGSVDGLNAIGEDVDGRGKVTELHISLTRPTYVRAHQREELKRAVRAAAKQSSPFTASFASFASLDNDERTRTFLAMEIGAGHTELKALSDALTPSLKAIRQKEFYPEPRFHASFAWALLDACRSGSTTPALRSTPPATEDAPPSSSVPAFPSIPHFPPSLVPALNDSYGSRLAERRAGVFEVEQIGVRIGKDVVGWRLGAV